MAITTQSQAFGARDITFEAGRMARLADGAVLATYGETQVLATCVSSNPREGIDFFPLTIDVEERMYAAGKIPGASSAVRGGPRRPRSSPAASSTARSARPSRKGSATRCRWSSPCSASTGRTPTTFRR